MNNLKGNDKIPKELIAPCGMNCAICSRYLSYVNNLNKSQCIGCRPGNKKCSYLFGKCSGMNSTIKGNATSFFCYECQEYPCKQINRMDSRYRKNYKMSVKDNLEYINKMGIDEFLNEQYKEHHCPRCDGLLSIHNRKCFNCDTVTKLVEKK